MINNNLIDKAVLGMCLFGIWSDVHDVGIVADIFYGVSIGYAILSIIGVVLTIIEVYFNIKLKEIGK